MKKLLAIFSIASITTIIIANTVEAKPTTYYGNKGTYNIDFKAGTYRGCLNSGGCISLRKKQRIQHTYNERTSSSVNVWKNGEYSYVIRNGELSVRDGAGNVIFDDFLFDSPSQRDSQE
jgi:hypothetical protein